MKTFHVTLCATAIVVLSSFASGEACKYASSNLNFSKTKTEEALAKDDINTIRFYTYKAIKAIQTSTNRFEDCDCKEAQFSIDESLINLKAATKSTSLNGTKLLLREALQQIVDAIDGLNQHELHDTAFSSRDFAMSTSIELENQLSPSKAEENELYRQIDASLVSYSKSINTVVETVNCKEARAFAKNIFQRCEQQLLKENLSEGKKYYNLKTKEITEKAISRLGDCDTDK